jgi:hypothetical protein
VSGSAIRLQEAIGEVCATLERMIESLPVSAHATTFDESEQRSLIFENFKLGFTPGEVANSWRTIIRMALETNQKLSEKSEAEKHNLVADFSGCFSLETFLFFPKVREPIEELIRHKEERDLKAAALYPPDSKEFALKLEMMVREEMAKQLNAARRDRDAEVVTYRENMKKMFVRYVNENQPGLRKNMFLVKNTEDELEKAKANLRRFERETSLRGASKVEKVRDYQENIDDLTTTLKEVQRDIDESAGESWVDLKKQLVDNVHVLMTDTFNHMVTHDHVEGNRKLVERLGVVLTELSSGFDVVFNTFNSSELKVYVVAAKKVAPIPVIVDVTTVGDVKQVVDRKYDGPFALWFDLEELQDSQLITSNHIASSSANPRLIEARLIVK